MKNRWLVIAMLFPLLSFSQKKMTEPRVTMITSAGFAAGEGGAKPLFQLSAGLTFDQLFTGIGIGFDQYNFNSFPLFADCRMSFGKTKQVFVYANGGHNFPASSLSSVDYYETNENFKGGFYMDAGVGYKINLGAEHGLSFSAGYSRKNLSNHVSYAVQCLVAPCPTEEFTYHYQFGRIVSKLSWEFGWRK